MDEASNRSGVRQARRRRRRVGAGGVPPHLGDDRERHLEVDVGRNLRRLRAFRDLSLRALAESSGLAVNTLSLIENNKSSPSVSTLQQLALALEAPITAFFETDTPDQKVAYIKADRRSRASFSYGTLEDLGSGLRDRPIEPMLVTLQPESGSGPHPIVHTGFEFVYCLEGRIDYSIEDRDYRLEPGDSLLFEAHLPHSWKNQDTSPAQAVLVLCPSDDRERPTYRHFQEAAPVARAEETGAANALDPYRSTG